MSKKVLISKYKDIFYKDFCLNENKVYICPRFIRYCITKWGIHWEVLYIFSNINSHLEIGGFSLLN